MSKNELVTIEDIHDVHSFIEQSMRNLKAAEPDLKSQKTYFNKNPAAWYRAQNETVAMGQKIKRDGDGNMASKGLTIIQNNMINLGTADQMKLLREELEKNIEYGNKMGYISEEMREAQVVPEVKGKNRLGK